MTKQKLIDYCLACPAVYLDYPFGDSEWGIVRHNGNKKGFAHIFRLGGKECVNLKCDPTDALFLREMYAGIVSAYHMSKTHWNTVRLDGDVPNEDVFSMVDKSYSLTKPKIRKAR